MALFQHINCISLTYDENNIELTDCQKYYGRVNNFVYLYNDNWGMFSRVLGTDSVGGDGNGIMVIHKSNLIDLKNYSVRQHKIVFGICTMSRNSSDNIIHIYLAFTHLKYILSQTNNPINHVIFNDHHGNGLLGFRISQVSDDNKSEMQNYVYFKLKQFFGYSLKDEKTAKTVNGKSLNLIQDEAGFLNKHIKQIDSTTFNEIMAYEDKFIGASYDSLTYKYHRIFGKNKEINEFNSFSLIKHVNIHPTNNYDESVIKNSIKIQFNFSENAPIIHIDESNSTQDFYLLEARLTYKLSFLNDLIIHALFDRISFLIKKKTSIKDIYFYSIDDKLISFLDNPRNYDENILQSYAKIKIHLKLEQWFGFKIDRNIEPHAVYSWPNPISYNDYIIRIQSLEKFSIDKKFKPMIYELKTSEKEFKSTHLDYESIYIKIKKIIIYF